ncbi:MAG TPA: hypothetical protein VLV83_22250 [Acidobacteriota bacterium]|nr:hypothetical protein [Acidobacteriota bacterium]
MADAPLLLRRKQARRLGRLHPRRAQYRRRGQERDQEAECGDASRSDPALRRTVVPMLCDGPGFPARTASNQARPSRHRD